jgi:hypothetical protein
MIDFKKYDIRNAIASFFVVHKRKTVMEKAKLKPYQLSNFLSGKGGLPFDAFARLISGMGWKLLDHEGKIILGDPAQIENEISDNNPKENDHS